MPGSISRSPSSAPRSTWALTSGLRPTYALNLRRPVRVIDVLIDDTFGSRRLSHVGLGLTRAEAEELKDVLEILLREDPGRHEHVSSADYQHELTLWITPRD